MLLAAGVVFLLTNAWPTDSWTLAAAPLLSGTFGYLSLEVLAD
jgi:hypothetical protein